MARDERFQNGNGGDPNSHVELARHGELVGAVASSEPDPAGATEADQAKLTLAEVGAIFAEAYALVLSRRRAALEEVKAAAPGQRCGTRHARRRQGSSAG